jgi:hypothetical protein
MTTIKAYQDNILCTEADFGDTVTEAGIIIKSTLGKTDGVVPRWFKVFDTGPKIDWLESGQWVLVEYGRWTEGIEMEDDRWDSKQEVWKVDPAGCLAVSDEKPNSTNLASDAIESFKKTL